jgi:hypothetical protein
MSWLIRKPGGTYWFRRGVPAKLRDIVGKREILVSLNTKDPAVAKKRAVAEAAKAERVLDEARKALENPSVYVYKVLQEDAAERLRHPPRKTTTRGWTSTSRPSWRRATLTRRTGPSSRVC